MPDGPLQCKILATPLTHRGGLSQPNYVADV